MKIPALPFRAALTVLAACALLASAHGQKMNYQGRLTDANGDPLADGQYTLTFSLHTAAFDGSQVWGPYITDGLVGTAGHGPFAEVVNGRFNVVLGPEDTTGRLLQNSFTGGDRFLQLQIGANDPISPRQEMLHAPMAIDAMSINATDRKLTIASRPTLGPAASSNFVFGSGRLLLESFVGGTSAGLALGGTGPALIYSEGGFRVVNENTIDAAGESGAGGTFFDVSGSGDGSFLRDLAVGRNQTVAGNLTVTGTIFGTLSGTLQANSVDVPTRLRVGSTTDTSHKVVIRTDGTADDALRLIGGEAAGSGARLNWGDADYVFIDEPFDDAMRIQADEVGVGGDPVNGGEKLQVFGSLKASGDITADVDLTAGGSVVADQFFGDMTGSFSTATFTSRQTTAATTYPLELIGITPFLNVGYIFRIDTSDLPDPDLIIDKYFNGSFSAIMAVLEPDGTGWRAGSDRTLKDDIRPLEGSLATVLALRPSSYRFKATQDGSRAIGFIAQEVEEVAPDLVRENDGLKTLNYGDFGVLAVGALQELHAEVQALRAQNAALEARLAALEAATGR